MEISFFRIVWAMLSSSVLIGIVHCVRKCQRLQPYWNTRTVALCYFMCMLRMCLPIVMPWSILVSDTVGHAKLYEVLVCTEIAPFIPITAAKLFCLIWAIVSCYRFLRFSYAYRSAKKIMTHEGTHCTQEEKAVFERVQQMSKRRILVRVRRSKHVDAPVGCGLCVRFILVPDRVYTETELYYILLHEYTHFIHRDILVKTWVSLFGCVFWWNPLVSLLERDLEQILELQCDAAVARQISKAQRVDYLQTILGAIQCGGVQACPAGAAALVGASTVASVRERFAAIADLEKRALSWRFQCVFVGAFAGLVIASYLLM